MSAKIKSTLGGNLRLRSNTVLYGADGKALKAAEGMNTNAINQPYNMPAPIVSNPGKINAVHLPDTYLYDIPTEAGQVIELFDMPSSAIDNIQSDIKLRDNNDLYNTLGQKVNGNYRGIVVTRGGKYMNH